MVLASICFDFADFVEKATFDAFLNVDDLAICDAFLGFDGFDIQYLHEFLASLSVDTSSWSLKLAPPASQNTCKNKQKIKILPPPPCAGTQT